MDTDGIRLVLLGEMAMQLTLRELCMEAPGTPDVVLPVPADTEVFTLRMPINPEPVCTGPTRKGKGERKRTAWRKK